MRRRLPHGVVPVTPGPGQESVWDYPRPPRLEPTSRLLRVTLGGDLVAETRRAHRVLETSHPPVYYIPPEDVRPGAAERGEGGSMCEWKGAARYWTVRGGGLEVPRGAWSYPSPTPAFRAIAGALAFYPEPMRCWVDGVPVLPQEGGFYGGWVTPDVVGPFKGAPGSWGW